MRKITDTLIVAIVLYRVLPDGIIQAVFPWATVSELPLVIALCMCLLVESVVRPSKLNAVVLLLLVSDVMMAVIGWQGGLMGRHIFEVDVFAYDLLYAMGIATGYYWARCRSLDQVTGHLCVLCIVATGGLDATCVGLLSGWVDPVWKNHPRLIAYSVFAGSWIVTCTLPLLMARMTMPNRKTRLAWPAAAWCLGTLLTATVISGTRSLGVQALTAALFILLVLSRRSKATAPFKLGFVVIAAMLFLVTFGVSDKIGYALARFGQMDTNGRTDDLMMMLRALDGHFTFGLGFGSSYDTVVLVSPIGRAWAPHIGFSALLLKGGIVVFVCTMLLPLILSLRVLVARDTSVIRCAYCCGVLSYAVLASISGGWGFCPLFLLGVSWSAMSGAKATPARPHTFATLPLETGAGLDYSRPVARLASLLTSAFVIMKVLHVLNTLNMGGAERLAADLVAGFQDRGIDAQLLVLGDGDGVLIGELRSRNIEVTSLGCSGVYGLVPLARVIRFFSQHDYDIVHLHLFPSMLYALLALALTRRATPAVLTEHNVRNRRRSRLLRPLDRWMYQQCRSIVCVSQAVRTSLCGWHPEGGGRSEVVNNGVVLADSDALPSGSGASRGKPIQVLSVGRSTEQKGFDVLIRAAALVDDVDIQIAGTGPLSAKLAELISSLDLGARVHLLGLRNDVAALMRAADVYVQSSRWEGMPVACIEAMSHGLPLIVSNIAELTEVAGGAAIPFEVDSPASLAGALGRLRDDPSARAQLARISAQRALSFSLATTLDHYLAIYTRVIGAKGVPSCPTPEASRSLHARRHVP